MSAILPLIPINRSSALARLFTPYQQLWIECEDYLRSHGKTAFILAEKSVRIGWTYADAYKNVRKRLRFRKRDYLFATKDYKSALEFISLCNQFTEGMNLARFLISKGEDYLKIPRLDGKGRPSGFTDEIKIGVIKFDNGSRIIAFSSNPQAMAVYGGDVGLDEFAKHPNAQLLWETAQGRVAWGYDLAVWSAHDGEDTLFNQFAQQARAACTGKDAFHRVPDQSPIPNQSGKDAVPSVPDPSPIEIQNSKFKNPGNTNSSPWNLYFRVTMPDAIELGLVDVINRTKDTKFSPAQFLEDCKTRSGSEEVFQQSYLCNPAGSETNNIVEWSVIERCRYDYQIERVHLEHEQIIQQFGEFHPSRRESREYQIKHFLQEKFPNLLGSPSPIKNKNGKDAFHSVPDPSPIKNQNSKFKNLTLGFDVAASGQGDLAVIYIDEVKGNELWLRGLFSCRTEDWHFLQTVLFEFLNRLKTVRAAGDSSGLGRQLCWEASQKFGSRFASVNFGSKKHDLGFALMNQLATARKRFPRSEQDIASDFFALRKSHENTRWVFSEGRNHLNAASHCDIAWAGALATHAHTENKVEVGGLVVHENGWFDGKDFHPFPGEDPKKYEGEMTLAEAARRGLRFRL